MNKRYQALRQFGSWVFRARRLGHDPFAALRRRNEDVDRRRERRALSSAEIDHLLEVARTRPFDEAKRRRVRAGVSEAERARLRAIGANRAFLYRFALRTGLRRGELKCLTWGDVDVARCTVTVRASVSKRRKRDELPLHAALADTIGDHRERLQVAGVGCAPSDLVFPGTVFPVNRTFRRDLEAAELAGEDERGRVVDFHSFRVTFITNLFEAGGLDARYSEAVTITGEATGAFRAPPFWTGPLNLTRYLAGVRVAPPGSINLAKGVFSPSTTGNMAWFFQTGEAAIVAADVVIDGGIAYGLYGLTTRDKK